MAVPGLLRPPADLQCVPTRGTGGGWQDLPPGAPGTGCWWRTTWPRRSRHRVDRRARCGPGYGTVVWVPGKPRPAGPSPRPGQAARRGALTAPGGAVPRPGVITPETSTRCGRATAASARDRPAVLLYDYTFRPDGTSTKAEALDLAYRTGVIGTDERHLHPRPYLSREAWCQPVIDATSARVLAAIGPGPADRSWSATSAHPRAHPDPALLQCSRSGAAPSRPPDWHRRFRACTRGLRHLHIPRTTFRGRRVRLRGGVPGYPYEQDRHPERPRQLDPDPACQARRGLSGRHRADRGVCTVAGAVAQPVRAADS